MLPLIVMSITQIISTNLYLSLGLIGALSIVRYRTPVKNQYELAYIFALIAIGIIGGVNPYICISLSLFLSVLPIIFKIFCNYFPKLNDEILRFNSSGKTEVCLTYDVKYDNKLDSIKNNNYEFVRQDYNSAHNEATVFLIFDSYSEGKKFINSLPFKTISISICKN